jgi:hypothetical protein
LRDLKLSESQKLLMVFGGLDIITAIAHQIEEESIQKGKTSASLFDLSKEMKEAQHRIAETLKKTPEVRKVANMFSEEETRSFNPIVFEIHLPTSLQAIGCRNQRHFGQAGLTH